jgi:hypothetical protein
MNCYSIATTLSNTAQPISANSILSPSLSTSSHSPPPALQASLHLSIAPRPSGSTPSPTHCLHQPKIRPPLFPSCTRNSICKYSSHYPTYTRRLPFRPVSLPSLTSRLDPPTRPSVAAKIKNNITLVGRDMYTCFPSVPLVTTTSPPRRYQYLRYFAAYLPTSSRTTPYRLSSPAPPVYGDSDNPPRQRSYQNPVSHKSISLLSLFEIIRFFFQ